MRKHRIGFLKVGWPQIAKFSSVQFSLLVMSNCLQPHGLQDTRPPCPSPTPGDYSRSCPLSQWCHSNHLILCRLLLLLPWIFLNIRVFSSESVLSIRWPKYWSCSFSISLSNGYSGLISFRMDWLDLFVVQGTLKSQWIRLWLHVYDWNSTDSYELKWLWTVISVEWSYPELLANTEKLQNFS